jgi:hypothetical protein
VRAKRTARHGLQDGELDQPKRVNRLHSSSLRPRRRFTTQRAGHVPDDQHGHHRPGSGRSCFGSPGSQGGVRG